VVAGDERVAAGRDGPFAAAGGDRRRVEPAARRSATTSCVAGTCGEAGALEPLWPGWPAAHVLGTHSSWQWRRPTDDHATVVAVRIARGFVVRTVEVCKRAGSIHNGLGIDNEAQGPHIWICRGWATPGRSSGARSATTAERRGSATGARSTVALATVVYRHPTPDLHPDGIPSWDARWPTRP
jgi:hypothetical protein